MSDLHRAVEDEIDAFRPDRIPPFAALVDRHRARSRRRYATGAAALSAVAVAGTVFVPSALFGGEDRLPSFANPAPTQAGDPELAARLCAGAAAEYSGEVAAAYSTTVQAVRDHMADPHGTGGDSSVGPIPGPYTYPAGWAEKAPNDPAAACYIDADFPTPHPPGAPAATRALVMATDGAPAFMATAGPKENLPPTPLTEPTLKEPDPTSAPDGTRYGIKYDSEASYNEHDKAVQACLDLPGTSEVGVDQSLPPGISVLVTGFPENTAFQKCLKGLAGVTLTEHIPYDPTTTPAEFVNRSSLPSCGQHIAGYGPVPRTAIDCFADALGGPAGAEYAVSRLTTEGDPTVVWYRALPGQQTVEVFLDSTRDKFGSQKWLQTICTGYDRATGAATGCPPNGTGQI